MRRTKTVSYVNEAGFVQGKAMAYVRVSTEEQATFGASLDAQEARVTAYCKAQNLNLIRLYREQGVSASKPLSERPLGSQLVGDIIAERIQHVIAVKLDRLFRNAVDAMSQAEAWDKRGVALHLIDMGGQALNTGGAMGRMMLTMMAAFAEFERNLIRERTSTALQYKKRAMKVYGPVPFGFHANEEPRRMADGSRAPRVLLADQGEGATVIEMRAWRQAGWTLRKIADELNAKGVRLKRGGKLWYASTVAAVLENRIHDRDAA